MGAQYFIKGFAFLSVLSIALPSFAMPSQTSVRNRNKTTQSGKIKVGSELWIEQKLRQFPELLWLTEPSTLSLKTPLSVGTSYSLALFNKKVPAFDITMRSLIYLHLLMQGSRQAYAQLAQMTFSEEAMTFKQYQSLHKQLSGFLNSSKGFDNPLKILETAIVLRLLGCSTKAVATFKPYFSDSCTETFYTKSLHVLKTFPELCPSFARLTPEQQEIFRSLRHFGNYESLFNLTEAPSPQLLSAGRSHRPLVVLDLYLYCFDASGHGKGSQDFYYSFSLLLSMLQEHATVEEAFSRYLIYRANRLGFEGNSRGEMTLVRLATLMNLPPAEASALSWSFKNLSSEEASTLVNHFYTLQGEHIPLSIHGLPSLISGLFDANRSTTTNPENRLQQVYSTFLSLLVKSLREQKEMLHKQLISPDTILDFSETTNSCKGLDVFSENISVRVHFSGEVSVIM